MTHKPPEKMRIGFFQYKVQVRDEIRDPANGAYRTAQINNETREVSIKKSSLDGGDWENSVLHEAVHAIDFQGCLGLDEHQVEILANGWEAFMRDNPEFLRKGG
jgi:hypothetical protein